MASQGKKERRMKENIGMENEKREVECWNGNEKTMEGTAGESKEIRKCWNEGLEKKHKIRKNLKMDSLGCKKGGMSEEKQKQQKTKN